MSRSIWGTLLDRRVLEQCELVLVEIHPELPSFASDGENHTRLHVSEVDGIIETSGPLVESFSAAGDDTDRQIAGYIADMVHDGDCLQFGLGGLAQRHRRESGLRRQAGSGNPDGGADLLRHGADEKGRGEQQPQDHLHRPHGLRPVRG